MYLFRKRFGAKGCVCAGVLITVFGLLVIVSMVIERLFIFTGLLIICLIKYKFDKYPIRILG
jgi:hypothetical protein